MVTLQWEPFEASLSQSGVPFLSVQQSVSQLPPYAVCVPIMLEYKSVFKVTFVKVDPVGQVGIKFYLDASGSGSDVVSGDHIMVPGGAVSWITNY